MKSIGIVASNIVQVHHAGEEKKQDLIAIEEPLEIILGYGEASKRKEFSLSVTMRTPGNDEELVLGFLLSEGIINSIGDIISIRNCQTSDIPENTLRIALDYHCLFDANNFERHFLSNSSCGICGKAVIDNVMRKIQNNHARDFPLQVANSVLFNLSKTIDQHQSVHRHTGGMHAAAIFDQHGAIQLVREDIGRHNALDKIVGAALKGKVKPDDKILWLSSRIGFELIQKATAFGFKTIVALGAPSSLAITLAEKYQLTLIGFLSAEKFNIYTGKDNKQTNEN